MLEVKGLSAKRDNTSFQWSFEVEPSSLVAVVGESGVGKSTLISTLLGFHPQESGEIRWLGKDIAHQSVADRPFGVLFQQNNLFEHLTVFQNMAFGLDANAKLSSNQKKQLEQAAERFGLGSYLKKRASDLSGGQQQRVALARVFLQNKPVLLLDEPFSSLDKDLREEGMRWVKDIQREHNTAVIMVTHHLDEISHQVDSVLRARSSSDWYQFPMA